MINKSIKYFFGGTQYFNESLENCIQQLNSYVSFHNLSYKNILFITIFIVSDKENFSSHNNAIDILFEEYQLKLPYIVAVQEPYDVWGLGNRYLASKVGFEILFIEGDFVVKESGQYHKLIEFYGMTELYACAQESELHKSTFERTKAAFDKLNRIMKVTGFDKSNIIRQWNYIEDITALVGGQQNYQQFNNARSEFYSSSDWYSGYPAATGIGVKAGGVGINIIAMKAVDDNSIFPIKSPIQKNAHEYSGKVLASDYEKNTTPKFERAKIIFEKAVINIYVSGTAAIIGENTIPEQDIESQTITILENIKALLNAENLKNNLPEKYYLKIKDIETAKISYLRVYVKNKVDIPKVEKTCNKFYSGIPVIYLIADICREELLVEIEQGIF